MVRSLWYLDIEVVPHVNHVHVGPDFDFVSNTENFNSRISENEAFFAKSKQTQSKHRV
jgi:hypothetical protein